MRKIVNLMAIVAFSAFVCACGMLSGLGNVPDGVKTSTADVVDGAKSTLGSFKKSQSTLLDALGCKKQAKEVLAYIKTIESGELDDISDMLEKSKSTNKIITENANKVKSFSSSQKETFRKALIEYVGSSIQLVQFSKSSSDYVKTVKDAIDSASTTDKAAITSYTQNVLSAVQMMPELTSLVATDTKYLIDTAQEAKLDVPNKKAAFDAFGF